jgi:hypothetical protein
MTILLETRNGIELYFESMSEELPLEDTFDDAVYNIKELYNKIDRGDLEYFVAHVWAEKNGIVLGEDYLGACLYESADQFTKECGHIDDMKNTAYEEATQAIADLCR